MKLPILGIMFLIMFALKLAGPMAATSWWIVTAPLWIPALIVGGLILIAAIVASKSKE